MFLVHFLASCCCSRSRPNPKHLALGDQVVKEVRERVVSSHDIISRVEIAIFGREGQYDACFKRFGPCYLEYMEHSERLQAVRSSLKKVPLDRSQFAGATRNIATTLFGVGECQEKAELVGLEIAKAGERFAIIVCQSKEGYGHEFNILGTSPTEFTKLREEHDSDLLATLTACKTGVVVDALFFHQAKRASKIRECEDFVNYMKVFKIEKISDVFFSSAKYSSHQLLEEGRALHDEIVRRRLISHDWTPEYFPHALAFLRTTKTTLMLQAMQRHFSQQGVSWKSKTEKCTVSVAGESESLTKLATEIRGRGVTCTIDNRTLFLKNTPVAELVHLEVHMALEPLLPVSSLRSITEYATSAFKELT